MLLMLDILPPFVQLWCATEIKDGREVSSLAIFYLTCWYRLITDNKCHHLVCSPYTCACQTAEAHVCIHAWMYISMRLRMYVCINVYVHPCACVYLSIIANNTKPACFSHHNLIQNTMEISHENVIYICLLSFIWVKMFLNSLYYIYMYAYMICPKWRT